MKSVFIAALLCGAIMFSPAASAQSMTPKQAIEGLGRALAAKDTSMLKAVVADNFSVGTASWPAAERLVQRIFDSQRITGISVQEARGAQKQDGMTLIKADVTLASGDTVTSDVAIGKDGRILYVDYFDNIFGYDRHVTSTLQARIPIEFTGSEIKIALRLNDNARELNFMFDSGADGMAISRALADSLGLSPGVERETSVVGGTQKIAISTGNTVHIGDITLPNQSIAIFDNMSSRAEGIIGLNLAKAFITRFDLDSLQLDLYSIGDYKPQAEGETIEVTVPAGVMIVPAILDLNGGKPVEGKFVFDTGAHYYLIGFSPFVRGNRLLTSGDFKPVSQTVTMSLGVATPTFNGVSADFRVGNLHAKGMPVALQAGPNWNAGADGSLGIKFISRYNFTIDLLHKQIHLTPNKLSLKPMELPAPPASEPEGAQ